jgi:hypothetical protein
MGEVSERNYGNKAGIGQHRGDGQPALNTGQKNILGTRGDVGNMSAGEKNNGAVPASRPDATYRHRPALQREETAPGNAPRSAATRQR